MAKYYRAAEDLKAGDHVSVVEGKLQLDSASFKIVKTDVAAGKKVRSDLVEDEYRLDKTVGTVHNYNPDLSPAVEEELMHDHDHDGEPDHAAEDCDQVEESPIKESVEPKGWRPWQWGK